MGPIGWRGECNLINLAVSVKECAVVGDDVKIFLREMDGGLEVLRPGCLSIAGQAPDKCFWPQYTCTICSERVSLAFGCVVALAVAVSKSMSRFTIAGKGVSINPHINTANCCTRIMKGLPSPAGEALP